MIPRDPLEVRQELVHHTDNLNADPCLGYRRRLESAGQDLPGYGQEGWDEGFDDLTDLLIAVAAHPSSVLEKFNTQITGISVEEIGEGIPECLVLGDFTYRTSKALAMMMQERARIEPSN